MHLKSATVSIPVSDHQDMLRAAALQGFASVSDYLCHLHAGRKQSSVADFPALFPPSLVAPYHRTRRGTMYLGDSRGYLFHIAREKSVDLVMTSPPFGLVRKKDYGNEDARLYCDWFRPFAEGCRRVLKDSGSLVVDIGGAWNPGTPTRSLYHFELLMMLCREYGFHLAQEHYWWNPSKLPTPAEWVNIRRVRVKDAVNTVWWLSPSPWPKADNRRVLAPYSASMRDLLANGYKAKTRPSGHVISEKFGHDNGGSVPPNLLAAANTESGGCYQDFCRDNALPIHPARFPSALPEYFVRMLTDPDDLVVDPFGGSCVTGMVAEALGRRWACVETEEDYLRGAVSRFPSGTAVLPKPKGEPYALHAPCALPCGEVPLAQDGGKARPVSGQSNEIKFKKAVSSG